MKTETKSPRFIVVRAEPLLPLRYKVQDTHDGEVITFPIEETTAREIADEFNKLTEGREGTLDKIVAEITEEAERDYVKRLLEEAWEKANAEIKGGVNPSAFAMGFRLGWRVGIGFDMALYQSLSETPFPHKTQEPGRNIPLTTGYILKHHPHLTEGQAADLLEFSVSRTISLEGCYGDGSIMYPKWRASIAKRNGEDYCKKHDNIFELGNICSECKSESSAEE